MALDISDELMDECLRDAVIYKASNGEETNIFAVIHESFEPGSESGKGLTRAVRSNTARFVRFIVKKADVPSPQMTKEFFLFDGQSFMFMSKRNKNNGLIEIACKVNSRYNGPPAGVVEI